MPMQDFRQGFRTAREKATYRSIKVLLSRRRRAFRAGGAWPDPYDPENYTTAGIDTLPNGIAGFDAVTIPAPSIPVPAQKPILHKNLSGLGMGLPMKIATDDF